jgi:poly(beta-D-mannuronate) lyase
MKKHVKLLVLALAMVSVFAMSFATLAQAATAKKLTVKAVTASNYQAPCVPKNTINGIDWTGGYAANQQKLEDRWSANGKGQWIKYQLSKAYTITQVEIAWHVPYQQATWFEVYTSTNNKTWTKVISYRLSHTILAGGDKAANCKNQVYKLSKATKGTYVKIVCFGNTSKAWPGWNSIREVKIWGY